MDTGQLRVANVMLSMSDKPWGTEMASYQYTKILLEKGHQVLFVHKNAYDLEHVDKDHSKLQCLRVPSRGWWSLLKNRRVLQQFKPDVIIVHNHFSKMLVLGKFIAPMIGVVHLNKLSALRRYDGVITLHPDTGQVARNFGLNNIAVIGHCSRLESRFNAGKQTPPSSPPVIGGIGSLNRHKNFDTFINALQILKQQNIIYKAVLAGDGAQRRELEELARRYKLPLEFLGYISDVEGFYESIDICCVPSRFEPFGLTLLDAMAMQKSIVASNLQSFRYLLQDGRCGDLFETESAEDMARVLREMIESPSDALEKAQRARKYYESEFSSSVIYEKLYNFLMKVAK